MGASRIAPKLYQGSVPPYGAELVSQGFHTLVLCAIELSLPDSLFPGIEVLRCPYADRAVLLSSAEWARVRHTGERVARRVLAGKRTLVTCAKGWNRSGLVTGVALTEIYGCSGAEAVTWVQQKRAGALYNIAFIEHLKTIPTRHPTRASSPAP